MTLLPAPARGRLRWKVLFGFVILSVLVFIAPQRISADALSAQSYLFSEDFEGPGFENAGWFKNGTPDED